MTLLTTLAAKSPDLLERRGFRDFRVWAWGLAKTMNAATTQRLHKTQGDAPL